MNKDAVIVEKIYEAPIDKVWKAITDKEQMKQWYFDLSGFKAEPGFEFSFYGQNKEGEKFLHLCRINEVIPGKNLAIAGAMMVLKETPLSLLNCLKKGIIQG